MTLPSVPADPSAIGAWTAALDDIEASLRAADALIHVVAPASRASPDLAVARVEPPVGEPRPRPADPLELVAAWAPPAGLPAVPEALVPRALAVLDAVHAVEASVAAAHATVGAELAQMAETGRSQVLRRAGYGDEVPSPRLVDHDA
ncbi:MAG: hypothetical protein JJE52_14245 [Acidimicrobiia bacterium]|nr:hypothetical protein [Acidimicrobiia bacterium]